ncbi:MAG TPA: hypothetical protein VHV30_07305, partial [Polyangiaceae bacterium]|nr:hypothetical protein [Polyangiaceae bacterium]
MAPVTKASNETRAAGTADASDSRGANEQPPSGASAIRPSRPLPHLTARTVAVARLVRALLVPMVLAVPPLFWVVVATVRASLTPLGRDQGIFQYEAWAMRLGQVAYRDIRDVNGPLTPLVHVLFLALGGADDHRFHALDLVVTGATFAVAGA